MKEPKKLVLLVFLSFLMLMNSCNIGLKDYRDWFCICNDVSSNAETSRFIIEETPERKAIKECKESDVLLLGVLTIDCELD